MEVRSVVFALVFDRDGNLWVGTVGNGALSNSWQRWWTILSDRMACPVILYLLFLKTEKGSYGLQPRMELTAFAIRESPSSQRAKAWEQTQPQAFWPAEMARSG